VTIESVFWIAVVAIGAYFLFFRKGHNQPQPTARAEVAEPVQARELTLEEAEIARARQIADAGSDAREEAYREHKAGLRDAEAKLSQADKFVRESELDIAVPWLFEEMQHWASWLSGPHDWKLPVDISEVEGGGSFGDQWVSWKWNDRKFKLHFLKQKDYDHVEDHEYGDFDVEADDQPVLQINCSRDWRQEFTSWHYFSTDALKVGPWIGELIEFYHVARLAHEKQGYDRDAEYTLGRAAAIELGEADGT
jgi:hypothetical protein